MSTKELIEKEVANLPEALQREVYDFARSIRCYKTSHTRCSSASVL
jgi:predicted secreted protein